MWTKISSRSNYDEMRAKEVIARDHGCVFCSMGYLSDKHIPIHDSKVYCRSRDNKMFAMCSYHAQFMRPAHYRYYASRYKEMIKIRDDYLKDKDNPQIF